MYTTSAHHVWEGMKERFHKIDGARTFNLHQEITSFTQGVQSVCVLFKIKGLMG